MHASSIRPGDRDATIHVDSEPDGIIAVCLDGDFDLANAPVLRDHVDSALGTGNDLIVDLSEATFIDCSVISILMDCANAVDGRSQAVVLQLATAPIVERALELVEIERVLRRAHSRTEAIQMLQQKPLPRRRSHQATLRTLAHRERSPSNVREPHFSPFGGQVSRW